MESEKTTQEQEIFTEQKRSVWTKVTPLSKYLAMALFIILPFVGGYIGYTFAPEKVVEVEKVVTKEVFVEKEFSVPETQFENNESTAQCVVNSDCVLVTTDCEDCEFSVVGANELDEFREEKRNRCELNPPEVMCDIVFNGEVKCVDNTCQLIVE